MIQAVYIFSGLISVCWLLFVLWNVYFIVLPGTKRLYQIFIVHLLGHFLILFIACVRPVWNLDMFPIYFRVPTLCHIYSRVSTFLGVFMIFPPTLFGYYKIKLYVQIAETGRDFLHRQEKLVAIGIMSLFISIILATITQDSGPHLKDGVRLCFKYAPGWNVLLITTSWFLVNTYITYVCIRFKDMLGQHIPQISRQMLLNVYVIPPLFLTTLIARFIPTLTDSCGSPELRHFMRIVPPVIDNLLNSFMMYWFIFGNANMAFLVSEERTIGEDESDGNSKSRSRSPSRYDANWISFTGTHPVRLDRDYIISHQLESLVIPEHVKLLQRKHYNKRLCKQMYGHYKNESSTTIDTDEFTSKEGFASNSACSGASLSEGDEETWITIDTLSMHDTVTPELSTIASRFVFEIVTAGYPGALAE